MQIGLLSLGDVLPDPRSGRLPTDGERTRAIVDAAVHGEQLGFELVQLGEHHGSSYQLSAPPVVLAAIAARTERIILSTGVTLAANLDPVRMAEDYATLDCIAGGRAEIVAGRGSYFARTFEYLGQDAGRSRQLFDEHVELLLALLAGGPVDHPGGERAPLVGFTSRPRPDGTVPVWVGGGTSAATPALAARHGLPLMLPSVFAGPELFLPVVDAYRQAWAEAGHPGPARIGAVAHCHVGATSAAARSDFEPHYRQYWSWVQGLITEYTPRARSLPFDFETLLAGPAVCGSPAEVVDRIRHWQAVLDLDRFSFMFDLGGMAVPTVRAAMERFAADVLPQLR